MDLVFLLHEFVHATGIRIREKPLFESNTHVFLALRGVANGWLCIV
jgi:hypothetical protein